MTVPSGVTIRATRLIEATPGLFRSEVEASAIVAEWEECLDHLAARIA